MAVEQVVSPMHITHSVEPGSDTSAHALNQPNFLSLSNPTELQSLVEHGKAFELSIQPEVEHLLQMRSEGHDGYLNITLPMVGVTDYLNSEGAHTAEQAFGSVLGLNQFLADSQQPHFSRPDFILAKDIIGNQYEILIEPDGKVAIPEDGTGKFSLLSEVTLMYSLDQVLEGRGLADAAPQLANHLYLLPPVGFQGKYAPVISVSETQEDFSEKMLSSRKVPILLESESHDMPILTESSLHQVSKFLFSEYDFTKAILSGDELGVKHTNGLNDFGLSPEAIGVYYDLWLHGVVTHQISPDEFLSRVNFQELLDMPNLGDLGLSAIEQTHLEAMLHNLKAGDFSGFHHLYESNVASHDMLSFHTQGDLQDIQQATHDVAQPVDQNLLGLSGHHQDHSENTFIKGIALTLHDVFFPEHHGGLVLASMNTHEDKIDLNGLLNNLPNNMPIQDLSLSAGSGAQGQGTEVNIHFQDVAAAHAQSQSMAPMSPLATWGSGGPESHLPDIWFNFHHDS